MFKEYEYDEHPEAIHKSQWVCLWNLVLPRLSQRRGKDSKISYVRTETENNNIIIGRGSSIPPFIVFVAIQVNYLWTRNGVCGPCFAVLTMDE